MKFLCDQCQAKYQIADEKAAGKTVRMKCRKCGHLIEVRASVVDGPVGRSSAPAGPTASALPAAAHAIAPAKAPLPPPRSAPLATSLAAARPAGRPVDKPGALASAFRSNVQRDEEVSAPIDMSDLSAGDEWYVAINGVPVGPIRVAEVRRKAAIGAVTEESLCWQEGLDEWRALRSFPELAAIVREAFASGRSSLTPPPPEARGATGMPPPQRTSTRPPSPAPAAVARAPAQRASASAPAPPPPRSNVVPFTSRAATAEKLAEPPAAPPRHQAPASPTAAPFLGPAIVPDPFAAPPSAAPPAATASAAAQALAPIALTPAVAGPFVSATPSFASAHASEPPPVKKGAPWMAIAMVVAAAAFGITAAAAIFLRPVAPPAPVVVQVAAPPPPPTTSAAVPAPGATAAANPTTTAALPTTTRGAVAAASGPRSGASAPSAVATRGLDLRGISPGSNVLPTDDPGGGDVPKATAGQGVTQAQVLQVEDLHKVALRRNCWERNPSPKTAVNVSVTFTVAGDGSVQGVSSSGDEPSVAQCIANDVRGWHFPATGSSQAINIPFHFVKQ